VPSSGRETAHNGAAAAFTALAFDQFPVCACGSHVTSKKWNCRCTEFFATDFVILIGDALSSMFERIGIDVVLSITEHAETGGYVALV